MTGNAYVKRFISILNRTLVRGTAFFVVTKETAFLTMTMIAQVVSARKDMRQNVTVSRRLIFNSNIPFISQFGYLYLF